MERLENELAAHSPEDLDETPETLGTRASIALLKGDFELAVTFLRRALETAPSDANLWSDLAAAYLEEARHSRDASLEVDALEAALEALELEAGH
ncbi:MAG: tetratricopeptide repeat protein, partial [Planctomycetota bacterium]